MTLLAFVLTAYRELAGLGPVSGMNDAYGWGIWKTFNVMVLTGLGSGAFAVGIAAWVFRRKRLHALMRMALLTSFLAYACGLLLLGIDAGRPWNFYWIVFPWKWNMHSPLAEVAICMSIYAMVPLAIENIPPVLERLWYFDSRLRPGVERVEREAALLLSLDHCRRIPVAGHAPIVIGRIDVAGRRTSPSPVADTVAALAVSGCVHLYVVRVRRRNHHVVLRGVEARHGHGGARRSRPHYGVADFRLAGVAPAGHPVPRSARHRLPLRSLCGRLLAGDVADFGRRLDASPFAAKLTRLESMFLGYVLSSLGGMIYRFSPTTLAFRPNPESLYFPTTIEVLVSLGFICMGVAGFLLVVKRFGILPAPLQEWHDMASYFRFRRPYIRWTGYFKYGFFGENEPTDSD